MVAETAERADLSEYLGRVIQGDCLDVMRLMPDGCVDAVVTDPPYGISAPGKVRCGTVAGAGQHESGNSVLRAIAGDWGPEDAEAGYGWIAEAARVLRPGGNLAVFCSRDQTAPLRAAIEDAGLQIRNGWYWLKTNPVPTPRENFCSAVECGWLAFRPGATPTWRGSAKTPNCFTGPLCTACYSTGSRIHPMQKPEWLIDEMIALWSNEGDLLLDPFSGSATLHVCAERAGRRCISIEKDPTHAANAAKRVEAERCKRQPSLALEAT